MFIVLRQPETDKAWMPSARPKRRLAMDKLILDRGQSGRRIAACWPAERLPDLGGHPFPAA
jgi:hypothetical protein